MNDFFKPRKKKAKVAPPAEAEAAPPAEAEDAAAPHKEFQDEVEAARAAFRAAVDALPEPPAPEADGEEDAPAPPPSLAPEERLVQFGVLEPIIVEAAVEEAAAPAPAPLEASDITAAVVEAADDSTVATEDQQPKEEQTQVGGTEQQLPPRSAKQAMTLQQLEQLKQQDKPGALHMMLQNAERDENAPPPQKLKKDW